MIRERYYYAVAAFMRKDGKLTYTSVTSSVKGEEKDIVFYLTVSANRYHYSA